MDSIIPLSVNEEAISSNVTLASGGERTYNKSYFDCRITLMGFSTIAQLDDGVHETTQQSKLMPQVIH